MSDKHKAALAYFSSIPWTASLINGRFTIHFVPHEKSTSAPARSLTQDQLFSTTLGSGPIPVPHQLCIHARPCSRPAAATVATANAPGSSTGLTLPITKVTTLYDLTPAVNGFNGTVHGGFVACLVDETMGAVPKDKPKV